jgi:hypothetical protein
MCNRSSAGRPVRVARELDEGEKRGRDCGGLVLALTLGLEFDFVLGAALDLGAAFGFEPTLALVDVGGVGFARLVVLPVSRVPTGLCLACGSDASLRGRFCERVTIVSCGLLCDGRIWDVRISDPSRVLDVLCIPGRAVSRQHEYQAAAAWARLQQASRVTHTALVCCCLRFKIAVSSSRQVQKHLPLSSRLLSNLTRANRQPAVVLDKLHSGHLTQVQLRRAPRRTQASSPHLHLHLHAGRAMHSST